jgi:hypothetical protein
VKSSFTPRCKPEITNICDCWYANNILCTICTNVCYPSPYYSPFVKFQGSISYQHGILLHDCQTVTLHCRRTQPEQIMHICITYFKITTRYFRILQYAPLLSSHLTSLPLRHINIMTINGTTLKWYGCGQFFSDLTYIKAYRFTNWKWKYKDTHSTAFSHAYFFSILCMKVRQK